ncbi:MAG: DUF2911 domain-containing protein [Flavobacteriaceae bacterium]|nr:DUF2911 domain-containing protein [Flavobacteriaceae bacterium]
MKKKILYTLLILFAAFIAYAVYTINNPASPLGTASFSENDKDITVTYSRPYKKGRLIFGSEDESALVPFDNYWRTGANRHTMIKTNSDLIFGDNVLSKGEYSLYTKPGLNTWDITFNSTNAYFGISQPDSEMDLFSITVPSNTIDEPIEQLTFDFVSDSLSSGIRLRWDLTEVVIPFN